MKYKVVYSPKAEVQLSALFEYVGSNASEAISAKFVSSIIDYCDSLETFPERGTLRDDLRVGLRAIGFRRRVTIAFMVEETSVIVLGIYYGGQNFEADFEG